MKIPFCVICVHLLLIGTTLFLHSAPQKMTKRSPITVKTYLTPTPQTTQVIHPTPSSVPPAQTTSPTLIKEITAPPQAPTKAPPLVSTLPVKRAKTEIRAKTQDITKGEGRSQVSHTQLITMMQKSLQTLNGSGAKGETTQQIPILGALASEALHFEDRYEVELISFLESSLSFPEKREKEEVKLKLTLKRDGSVQKIEILQAHSEKNRHYCESTLRSLSFPPFGTYFKGKNQKMFTITLKTEH